MVLILIQKPTCNRFDEAFELCNQGIVALELLQIYFMLIIVELTL